MDAPLDVVAGSEASMAGGEGSPRFEGVSSSESAANAAQTISFRRPLLFTRARDLAAVELDSSPHR